MADDTHIEERPRWTAGTRRLGITAACAVLGIGVLYVAVIGLWLAVEATPSEPIGDPYLALMEVLTIASALALLGWVVALHSYAGAGHRTWATLGLVLGGLAAGLTSTVHFVQLTAIRQLWHAGYLLDYRLVWPSVLFAAEYFAWDILVGLTMAAAGLALSGVPPARRARRALLAGGLLCLLGAAGPISGAMALQNVAVFGYAIVLPVAAALTARLFRATPATN
jgi:hypothetical protein